LHFSWSDCADEIKRCHDEAQGGFFFLTLQGDKFGHTTLPQRIEKKSFETCLQDNIHMYENKNIVIDKEDIDISGHASPTDEKILDMLDKLKNPDSNRSLASIAKLWYELEENSIPPTYLLRGLNESNRPSWEEDKVCLLKFFENVICYRDMLISDDDEPLITNRSVAEFEIKYACSLAGISTSGILNHFFTYLIS
jgi:hypothetical protein